MNRPAIPPVASVGDLVVCQDPAYRENLKIPGELGLVLESRRDRARVYFPGVGGEPWVPTRALARVRDPLAAADVPPWMQRAWFLARTLDAQFMEIAHLDAEGCGLRIYHGEFDGAVVDAVRDGLGDELRYYTIHPAGMHKVETAVAFLARVRGDAPRPLVRTSEE